MNTPLQDAIEHFKEVQRITGSSEVLSFLRTTIAVLEGFLLIEKEFAKEAYMQGGSDAEICMIDFERYYNKVYRKNIQDESTTD